MAMKYPITEMTQLTTLSAASMETVSVVKPRRVLCYLDSCTGLKAATRGVAKP